MKILVGDEEKIIVGEEFAYDDCHKIYIIEDEYDKDDAIECGYDIYPIKDLKKIWKNSCSLRFISNWKLTVRYVNQFESVRF